MRLTASLLRRKIPLLATASATAALGLVAIVPLAAQATTSAPLAYFTTWQLGTPLPVVPAGWRIEAMPSNQVPVKDLSIGEQLHLTPVALPANGTQAAATSASAAATTALAQNANANGVVNLVEFQTPDYCLAAYNGDEGDHWDDIAQNYVTDAHDNQQFAYDASATSTMTIGYSTTNAFGSFSADGTTGVGGGGGATWPYFTGKGNYIEQTEFDWVNYKWSCGAGIYFYTSVPYSWLYGSGTWYNPATPKVPPKCGFERKGLEPYINKTTAKTITVAYNVMGFSGSSQTGYTTNLSVKFYYGENGYLCGDQLWPNNGFDWPMAIP